MWPTCLIRRKRPSSSRKLPPPRLPVSEAEAPLPLLGGVNACCELRLPHRALVLARCGLAIPGAGGHAAVAELELLHLAVLRHRQCVDEFDETRHREISEPRPAEFAERAFGERTVRPPDDGGHDLVFGEF